MGPILVTGATGLVGNAIARRLAERGDRVRALVRDPARARGMLPAEVELVAGDVTAPESLVAATEGARLVFHAAGLPEQWQRDEGIFDRVNRGGTANALAAAKRAGVERVVYTSTMDVFAAPTGGTLVESNVDAAPKATAYERSKQAAEREAEAIARTGLDVVYVNPSGVYGPSPVVTALNVFFQRVLLGKVPMLPPGGLSVVYVDGVAGAHVAAAERGKRGERYLVSDGHVSIRELATMILEAEGRGRRAPADAPVLLAKALAAVSAPVARAIGVEPMLPPSVLSFLLWDARVDATKAERELGFVKFPVKEGVKRTVEGLRLRLDEFQQ
jgi:nucleoside-diphosphate-sugar epimerase